MALDVWVGSWDQPGSTLVASFEPEAYFWFLYPLIDRLNRDHAKRIDLYDGCSFEPDELNLTCPHFLFQGS